MLDILKFIMSSPWIFFGHILLILTIGGVLVWVIHAAYRIEPYSDETPDLDTKWPIDLTRGINR